MSVVVKSEAKWKAVSGDLPNCNRSCFTLYAIRTQLCVEVSCFGPGSYSLSHTQASPSTLPVSQTGKKGVSEMTRVNVFKRSSKGCCRGFLCRTMWWCTTHSSFLEGQQTGTGQGNRRGHSTFPLSLSALNADWFLMLMKYFGAIKRTWRCSI